MMLLTCSLIILALAINVSATISISSPAANGVTYNGLSIVAATTTQVANVSFFYNCGTLNTTATLLAVNLTTNNSGTRTFSTYVSNFSGFYDDNDCVITVTDNESNSDTNIGIINDNTVPTAATGLESGIQTEDEFTLSVTVNNKNTMSCTVINGENGGLWSSLTELTLDRSANTCSRTYSIAPGGIYSYKIRTSDGTNTTDTALSTVEIVNPSKGHTAASLLAIQKQNAKSTSNSGIGILVLLGIGAYVLMKK